MRTVLLAALAASWLYGSEAAHAQRHLAVARIGGERLSTLNMPPGWQWPPSPAMQASGERCLAALREAGVAYQTSPRRIGMIATPVVVPDMVFGGLVVRPVFARRPPVMDCHMALALQQHAEALSRLGVREVIVAGFYQPRRARLRGRSLNLLSRHALGLAVDIRAFVTSDGRTLSVRRAYADPLMQRIEAALLAPGGLRAVVTPRNDRAHRNHFHISAKMTIDPAHPDPSVDVAELLGPL